MKNSPYFRSSPTSKPQAADARGSMKENGERLQQQQKKKDVTPFVSAFNSTGEEKPFARHHPFIRSPGRMVWLKLLCLFSVRDTDRRSQSSCLSVKYLLAGPMVRSLLLVLVAFLIFSKGTWFSGVPLKPTEREGARASQFS